MINSAAFGCFPNIGHRWMIHIAHIICKWGVIFPDESTKMQTCKCLTNPDELRCVVTWSLSLHTVPPWKYFRGQNFIRSLSGPSFPSRLDYPFAIPSPLVLPLQSELKGIACVTSDRPAPTMTEILSDPFPDTRRIRRR